jgi:biofilm PGA synthesis N-glycosyltransferase PgaC
MRWIIVSDGSTDGTDEIVAKYVTCHPWIELLRMPTRRKRDFAGKVLAFNAGYDRVRDLPFEVVVSLDADISFGEDYFSFLLQKLAEDRSLGLVGTPFRDLDDASYDYRFASTEHVSGACQVFRRQCFEEIGGYVPAKGGGIDRIANLSCRMKGWRTHTFTEKSYMHHRKMGGAENGQLGASFKNGCKDYAVGTHPVWMLFRVAYQMSRVPYIIGGLALAWGYVWSYVRITERPVSLELVEFNRQEQLRRLKHILRGHSLRNRVSL